MKTFKEIRNIHKEGTWAVANTKDKMKALNNMMKKALIIKKESDVKKAIKSLGRIIGDDRVEDQWFDMADKFKGGSAAMDARDPIVKFLENWGFTVKNYQITHYPQHLIQTEAGHLKKPKKGKLLKLESRIEEAYKEIEVPWDMGNPNHPRFDFSDDGVHFEKWNKNKGTATYQGDEKDLLAWLTDEDTMAMDKKEALKYIKKGKKI